MTVKMQSLWLLCAVWLLLDLTVRPLLAHFGLTSELDLKRSFEHDLSNAYFLICAWAFVKIGIFPRGDKCASE